MNAAVEALALLVLLAMPAALALRWDWDDDYDEPDCHQNVHAPKISFKTPSMDTFEDPGEFFQVLYGEDITVVCTASDVLSLRVQKTDKHLKINKNKNYLDTETINNTIRWNISRPDVGRYRYRCVDTISRCQDTMYFMVAPLASVVSKGVRHVLRTGFDKRFIFYVPHGETYQIFCTGSNAESLKIRLNSWTLLPTVTVNQTTVSYEGHADRVDTLYYTCSGEETAWFHIIVDYPPEAQEFLCTSYNRDKIACTWNSLTPTNTFNVFYRESINNWKLLCTNRLVSASRECKWNKIFIWDVIFFLNYDIALNLAVQSCNEVYCRNQTFEIAHISIMKLNPVSNLTVISTSSRGAVVSWAAPHQGFSIYYERKRFKHVYKVEYRLLHKRWRQADASVRCDDDQCLLELKLDCPEQHYELRVYVRLEKAEDRLWSEPVAISFYTSAAADEAPAACVTALQESEPVSSSDMALGKVFQLIRHTIDRHSVLREQVRGMRLKLGEIKGQSLQPHLTD